MTDYPTLSFREPIKRVSTHIRFAHADGRKTTIPDHGSKDVPHGLLIKIIRYDLEMDLEEFFER
jgi:predicted RNA binding protein YcfA (HicA-like mRNA interferase family)